MTDDRFFTRHGPFSLADLAAGSGTDIAGEAAGLLFKGIAPLETAEPDDVSVFCDPRHGAAFAVSRAGAIVTTAKLAALPHACTAPPR